MRDIKFKRTEMVVEGRGHFPIDMLRYDMCVPVEGDVNLDWEKDSYQVKLFRFSELGTKGTAERWRSFGWVVVSDNGRGT